MQTLTKSIQEDTSNIEYTQDETPNKNYSLIKNEVIEGTPFRMIGTEKGWFITLGNARMSEVHETENQALGALVHEHWYIVMRMAARITELYAEEQEIEKSIPMG